MAAGAGEFNSVRQEIQCDLLEGATVRLQRDARRDAGRQGQALFLGAR